MAHDNAGRPRSEAHRAFMEAIELGIQERSPYPDGAVFIDAEQPGAGRAIAQSVAGGKPVVLCSPDGTRVILESRPVPEPLPG
jgi:hypothetical protein